jgi:alkylated DNA nucleotide flippase Atl1
VLVLHTKEIDGRWFGVACAGEGLVATAVSPTRAATLGRLRRSLPPGIEHRIGGEDRSDYVEKTIALLVELEASEEGHKRFSLASEYVAESLASVLKIAAAIPLGYVTTYGNIASVSGAEARDGGESWRRIPSTRSCPATASWARTCRSWATRGASARRRFAPSWLG